MPLTPRELIMNLGDLPPLPQVAARVLQLSADAETSADELQRLIGTDQALSAQLLKIANSAMFGMVREVTTLTQAVMTLGFSTCKSVVIACSVKNLYSRGPAGLQERILWEHSLVAALTAAAYGKALRFSRTEEVFLAALMHDIGKSVMAIKFPEAYGGILRRVQNLEGEGLALELDAFGFDHAMVGEALLHSWNIAPGIEAAVRWHHNPSQADVEYRPMVALVALGNLMAVDLKVGHGRPQDLATATFEAMDILHLDETALEGQKASVLDALDRDKALITDL